jgi:hypothetical protein
MGRRIKLSYIDGKRHENNKTVIVGGEKGEGGRIADRFCMKWFCLCVCVCGCGYVGMCPSFFEAGRCEQLSRDAMDCRLHFHVSI